MTGKTTDSFITNDLMRFPLGILTGVGFIGGGAILRRDNIVVGVTTAATLWLATVVGLCLGGGQTALGAATTVLGICALWSLKRVEQLLRRERSAKFAIEIAADGPSEEAIRATIALAGLQITGSRVSVKEAGAGRHLFFDVSYAPDAPACPLFGERAMSLRRRSFKHASIVADGQPPFLRCFSLNCFMPARTRLRALAGPASPFDLNFRSRSLL